MKAWKCSERRGALLGEDGRCSLREVGEGGRGDEWDDKFG